MSTKIQWTDETWNPLAGCSVVSAGCKNCYAMRMAHRLEAMGQAKYQGLTRVVNGNAVWNGRVNLDEAALNIPKRWTKPRRVFVNSMSDLFHDSVPDDFIYSVFTTMSQTPQHTYQVLTKRPERMCELLNQWNKPDAVINLPNVWLGVSVENQDAADERIPLLLMTPATVRFLSCEPLLGPVSITDQEYWDWRYAYGFYPKGMFRKPIDWVIVGGESGSNARPMHPDWAKGLRDQCIEAEVPFFFKQHGEWIGDSQIQRDNPMQWPMFGKAHFGGLNAQGEWHEGEYSQSMGECMYRIGKHGAGRLLDGRTWDEYPVTMEVPTTITTAA